MAVIHISEAEAARTLPDLIAKVRAGERVEIESESESFALVPANEKYPVGFPVGWTTADALRQADARNSSVTLTEAIKRAEEGGPGLTLDDQYGDDMEEIMRLNREGPFGSWESF